MSSRTGRKGARNLVSDGAIHVAVNLTGLRLKAGAKRWPSGSAPPFELTIYEITAFRFDDFVHAKKDSKRVK